MNARLLFSFAFFCLLFLLQLQLHAQSLELPAVPEALPAAERQRLVAKHAELQGRWDAFLAEKAAFISASQGIKVPSPEADAAAVRKAALKAKGDAIVSERDIFAERLATLTRVLTLDAQIAETEKQLSGLGFTKAVPDFAWFAGQSERAQQHMIEQLVSQLRDYTIAKSEAAMREHFLEYISTMSNRDVNRLADQLASIKLNNDVFERWLRAYSRRASRQVLQQGATLTINAIQRQDDLFKIHESVEKGTVEGQQEAALTVISMVADHPALKELKSVAAGAYDVGEAAVTIFVLNQGIDQLTTATETQLANQKRILLHMKALVDERKEMREKLAKL